MIIREACFLPWKNSAEYLKKKKIYKKLRE